jgi:hypothetical protein
MLLVHPNLLSSMKERASPGEGSGEAARRSRWLDSRVAELSLELSRLHSENMRSLTPPIP